MSCPPRSSYNLGDLDADPQLESKVDVCLCKTVSGVGTTDLTGVGVILSFIIQLSVALLFWLSNSADHVLVLLELGSRQALFRAGYKASKARAVLHWIHQFHDECLTTHLIFTLSFAVAGVISQSKNEIQGVFESAAVVSTVSVSFLSTLLVVVSSMRRINKIPLFVFCFALTTTCSVLAVIWPLWAARTENILQACVEYAKRENLPWQSGAVKPYRNAEGVGQVFGAIASILVVLGCWIYLRRVRWDDLPQSFKQNKHLPMRILTASGIIGCVSIFFIYNAFSSLLDLLAQRRAIDELWAEELQEHVWTIGQVGAPFAWFPLLSDMFFSAIESSWQYWQGTE